MTCGIIPALIGFLPVLTVRLLTGSLVIMPLFYFDLLFAVMALVFGAIVGSFLNVCIYRLPLGLSVNEPRRSFCPNCKTQIVWYENLPVVSWLFLQGRCAHCHQRISVRYPLVELLTAALFFLVLHRFRAEWILIGPYWIFVALVIVATFIDFDHFIIPHEITWGCTAAGLLLSLAIPQIMGETSHLLGLLWSLVGAGAGFLTLWGVVEAGKLAFGKKRVVLPQAQDFVWQREGEHDARMSIGTESELWSEYFPRGSEELVLHCDKLTLAGREHANAVLRCFSDRLELDGKAYPLARLDEFSGSLREYVFPREAMGFGDVFFIAGIGAFLGWKAVFFAIATASTVGSVVGVTLLALGPKTHSLKIPFGPYLSLGALLWMFAGPEIVRWYFGLMHMG